MNRKICIGSGWYADDYGHNNPKRSSAMLAPTWMYGTWRKYIECFIRPDKYFIYHSFCPIMMKVPDSAVRWEIVVGLEWAPKIDHRHDGVASILLPAQYALMNGMDLVYIEQDCFVYGLDKAIEWAQKDSGGLFYGYGDNCSFAPDWAEIAFTYIKNEYLPMFIFKLNDVREWNSTTKYVEEMIHSYFLNDVTIWPFGYGRERPIDWNEKMFFAQQMSNSEIERFIEKVSDKWNA